MGAVLPDGKNWLYRPLAHGLCKYESYKNGALDLEDIAELNELVDVMEESRQMTQRG